MQPSKYVQNGYRMCHSRIRINQYCDLSTCEPENTNSASAKKEITTRQSHTKRLNNYFNCADHLAAIKKYIPEKYLRNRRESKVENLYLVDSEIAKHIANIALPLLRNNKIQMVCETNAGLGLITSELLKSNQVELVRLYETCPEFRIELKDFNRMYPGRVELFKKDMFQLQRLSFFDKIDRGTRVKQMLRGVPRRSWSSDPIMTIIGAIPKVKFINYLIRACALQTEVVTNGRIQLIAVMRPRDFIKLTAGPHLDLRTYSSWSVLFHLFFEIELLDKLSRQAFVPWEMKSTETSQTRYADKIDKEYLYLTRLNFKKTKPVENVHLLALFYFVRQFFGRGKIQIIPALEKIIPGIGASLIMSDYTNPNPNKTKLSIFTTFGELPPEEILDIFKKVVLHPRYQISAFTSIIDVELMKTETVETVSDYENTSPIIEEFQEKLG